MNEFGKPLIFLNKAELPRRSARIAHEASEEQDEQVRESLELNGEAKEPPSSSFSGEEGNGITGTCSAPPPRYFAKVGDEVQVPSGAKGAFENIPINNVHCFTMAFPKENEHKSVLLPGAKPDQYNRPLTMWASRVSRGTTGTTSSTSLKSSTTGAREEVR